MFEISLFDVFLTGFLFGLGWFGAKALFVVAISKFIGKPIEISKGEA